MINSTKWVSKSDLLLPITVLHTSRAGLRATHYQFTLNYERETKYRTRTAT